MRIKYGSNKTKQKVYSSRMQTMMDPNANVKQASVNSQVLAVSSAD